MKPVKVDLYAIQSHYQVSVGGNFPELHPNTSGVPTESGIQRFSKLIEADFLKEKKDTRVTVRLNHFKTKEQY
jgi:hypothetical protein